MTINTLRQLGFPVLLLSLALGDTVDAIAATRGASIVDTLSFGDATSEQAHQTKADASDIVMGILGDSARRLLPRDPPNWEGGKVAFTMKVEPAEANYLTVRLSGSDVSGNRLVLFCEGKQIGYRHLGDIDSLDIGSEAPLCAGRFFYNTSPLPVEMTKGKTAVRLEIRSSGPIWGYGRNWEEYQKNMTRATRGLYRVYTHTDGTFVPPASEKQGLAPADPPLRQSPGPEVIEQVKKRVNGAVDGQLKSARPLGQMPMQFLARAYFVKWTSAHQNPKAVEQAVKSLDAMYVAYRKNPKLAESEPGTPNADWFGLGPSGQVISLLAEPLKPRLDEKIDDGAGHTVARRAGLADMLVACRDWHRQHRRQYTNQSMINDLYGIYWANRGVAVVDPAKAMPEIECRRYLYESLGVQPWLGSDTANGPSRSAGANFFQLTAKGLTRELGYVGNYGEVLDWATQIYDATRPAPDKPGDPRVKERLAMLATARAAFRYPAVDADGNRAMRMETIVGWRDVHYPGDVTYAQRPSWDGSPVEAAAATLDPHLVSYVQQMLADNQFFATMQEHMKDAGFRTVAGLLGVPDGYDLLNAQPPSPHRLPITRGGDNFVFADEEDGVIAIQRGDEILYASLYWRARNAVNFLARVHAIGPAFDRIATVRQEEEFEPSGMTYTRPDWVNFGFANGGFRYPGDLHSAHAGEKLPIAKIPDGLQFRAGQESLYAGRALFYRLRYGDYLIGMNASRDKTYALAIPAGVTTVTNLTTGIAAPIAGPVKVGPMSTVVLYLGK